MDIHSHLKQLDLNHSEITVYLFLLENGVSTPSIVSRETKIARTNCYHIFKSLELKGLISEQLVGKRKAYLATNPEALLSVFDRKKEALRNILPDLHGLYTTHINKPKVRYFDGLDQIKNIYLETLQSNRVLSISSANQLSNLLPEFWDQYIRDLKNRGGVFSEINSSASKKIGGPRILEALNGLYESSFLPEKYKDFPINILIWNDNIAFVVLEEPAFGTVLTNKLLADTLKIIFEVLKDAAG